MSFMIIRSAHWPSCQTVTMCTRTVNRGRDALMSRWNRGTVRGQVISWNSRPAEIWMMRRWSALQGRQWNRSCPDTTMKRCGIGASAGSVCSESHFVANVSRADIRSTKMCRNILYNRREKINFVLSRCKIDIIKTKHRQN